MFVYTKLTEPMFVGSHSYKFPQTHTHTHTKHFRIQCSKAFLLFGLQTTSRPLLLYTPSLPEYRWIENINESQYTAYGYNIQVCRVYIYIYRWARRQVKKMKRRGYLGNVKAKEQREKINILQT